ncbi:hypothetical protein GGR54DRAFT_581429 [Hypoxylon sp. NC1633]|nr:hypothetical protein GGR54DRAFT_581429 [Hypoxylon sp. NC1633]
MATTISWGTIKSLLIFFGPWLIPSAIRYYRSFRAAPQAAVLPIQPIPRKAFRALAVLAGAALVFVLRAAVPYFEPENIFERTQSRLQIPTDVLFNRLSSLRPGNVLTPDDDALRVKFVNLESRLLYLQFGPDVLAHCPFCTSDYPRSYLYYALPALLAPHLLNLIITSLATSSLVAGPHGPPWRTTAAVLAVAFAAADIYAATTYNHQGNARATRLADLHPFFWLAQFARHLALASQDIILSAVLYLSSTNRWFVAPPGPAARVEAVTRALQSTKGRLAAVGILKNAAVRDEAFRARAAAYWAHEGALMREVMEDREVVEGLNDALANRIDIAGITRDADVYSLHVLPSPPEAGVPESTVG